MATLKTIKRNHRSESLRGRFMVDTVRGVLRVRKWPKKRGTPTSESQLWWIDWFRQANKLCKYIDAASMRRAIELTAGTGKYPRDIILQAMRGRLYVWTDENGKVWYPMAGVQDISDTLDILAQGAGSLLVRWADRWRDVAPGSPGDVLTHQAADAPPEWVVPSGGGGYLGGALVKKSANQSIPNAVGTYLTFDQEEYDTHAIHDNVTNNSRLTVPADVTRVQLTANVYWDTNSTGYRVLTIHKNGTFYQGNPQTRSRPVSGTQHAVNIQSPVLEVSPGDYFEAKVTHTGGGALNLRTGSNTWFSMSIISLA